MKLIIADDNLLDLKFLEVFLKKFECFKIVGKATNGNELLTIAKNFDFDLIITDLYMPILDAIEVIKLLRIEKPNSNFIVHSSNNSRFVIESITTLERVIYISKYSPDFFDNIESQILNFRNNRTIMLSDKERQVFTLLLSSKSTKQICDLLCTSAKNLERYKTIIYDKFNVKNRVELISKFS